MLIEPQLAHDDVVCGGGHFGPAVMVFGFCELEVRNARGDQLQVFAAGKMGI